MWLGGQTKVVSAHPGRDTTTESVVSERPAATSMLASAARRKGKPRNETPLTDVLTDE